MIIENIEKIKARIDAACRKAGRDPAGIVVVAVAKGVSLEKINEAIGAGIADIGENKVQEALAKYAGLKPNSQNLLPVRWHMVGHLQTNKAKDAVGLFDLIQSVDTLKLLCFIDKEAGRINKIQDVLVEVNTSAEETKFGIATTQAASFITEGMKLGNIKIRGLMTIGPLAQNQELVRGAFGELRLLRNAILKNSGLSEGSFNILSMGMSDDFEAALEEGATMLRLGRAIFKE